ncbi:MAG: xylulokinase [Oscillospiraceae bacterium]|nr:xylulokinase [Oscillospiraceae bacterium]
MKRYVIGVDLGTSGCKVLLADELTNCVAASRQTYAEGSMVQLHPGWVDQDPDAWVAAMKRGIIDVAKNAIGGKVEAISFSGQMHGLIALDADGKTIRPCITCADGRTEEQCQEIYEMLGGREEGRKKLLACTNNYMFPSFTATKILWLKKYEPESFKRMSAALNPKDYLRYVLTGIIGTDVSDACGYGLFDCRNNCWSQEILDAIGIPADILPPVSESDTVVGTILPECAKELGLPADVKIVAGGGDAVTQTTGCGAVRPGVFTVTLGTGSLIGASFTNYVDNTLGTPQMFRSNSAGRYMAFGGTGSGGGALAWLQDRFFRAEKETADLCGKNVFAMMSEEAESVPAGSEGLMFYPMLVGQRCPYEDADTCGAFLGMRMHHDKRHFVRSLMEGIALCLLDNYDVIRPMCGDLKEVSITGGGAGSDLWCQIHADVLGVKVIRYASYSHGGAMGACMIAGCGVGIWNDLPHAASLFQIDKLFTPDEKMHREYLEMLKIYKQFYPALEGINHSIMELQ